MYVQSCTLPTALHVSYLHGNSTLVLYYNTLHAQHSEVSNYSRKHCTLRCVLLHTSYLTTPHDPPFYTRNTRRAHSSRHTALCSLATRHTTASTALCVPLLAFKIDTPTVHSQHSQHYYVHIALKQNYTLSTPEKNKR